jgi:hypothetical protein
VRHDDSEPVSPYYPPRSSFLSRLVGAVRGLTRQVGWRPEYLPENLTLRRLLLGLAVPGYSYWLDGVRLPARLILGGWLLGLAVFLILQTAPAVRVLMFQFDPAYLAFGLIISLHSTSANYLIARAWKVSETRARILTAVLVTLILICGVYFPIWQLVQHYWFVPVEIAGTRLVIDPRASPLKVQRGDVVLYRIAGSYDNSVLVRAGLGLQRVLGVPGDHVRFQPKTFEVAGRRLPLLPEMPQSGELDVPEKHWFIWPTLNTGGHGNLAGQRQAAYLQLALVDQADFAGRLYPRWFFWKQVMP